MLKISQITISKLESGKLKEELPEFYDLEKIIENNPWHNNESTFVHTLTVLKRLNKILKNSKDEKLKKYLNKKVGSYKRKELLFLAGVLHDLGKKETIQKNGKISSFPEHEKISISKARKILKKSDLSKKDKDIVLGVIKNHSRLHSIVEADNVNLEKQFDKLKNVCSNFIVELVILVMADTADSYLKETNSQKYNFRMRFYREKVKTLCI